jgi:hypothetical protein
MGAFLDRFESWFLNYSRRTLSFLVLVLILIGTLYFFVGLSNQFDSVNSERTDSFLMPEYVAKEDVKTASTAESSKEEKKSESDPMTAYEDEILEIVQHLRPFYIKFRGWDDDYKVNEMLTNYVESISAASFAASSDEQIEDVVSSLQDYSEDFFYHYVEKFPDLDEIYEAHLYEEKLESITYARGNKEMSDLLKHPLSPWVLQLDKNRLEHYKSVASETAQVMQNNVSGMGQLMIAGSIIGVLVFLILLLLVFKAEQSLRRSADSREAK